MDYYIKFEDSNHVTLPQLFSDILIYCTERNVMLVDLNENNQIQAENVIFIGLICKMLFGMLLYLKSVEVTLVNYLSWIFKISHILLKNDTNPRYLN